MSSQPVMIAQNLCWFRGSSIAPDKASGDVILGVGSNMVNEGEAADKDLIRDSRAGDQNAVENLYRRHHDAGYRYARGLLGNVPDAEDAAHEAFAKVMAAIARGNGPDTAFRPYYLRAIRTAAADKWAQQSKESPVEEVQETPAEDPRLAFPPDSSQAALTAFRSLPRRWQTVLWHAEVEREPPRRIAPLLGIEPNAVSALLLRARKGLREAYLRAHAPTPANPECSAVFPFLASTVLGTASVQDRRASSEHARSCDHCARAMTELTDIGKTMRGKIAPLLLLPPGALASAQPPAAEVPRPHFSIQGAAAWGALAATIAGVAITAVAVATTAPAPLEHDVAPPHMVTSSAPQSATATTPPPPAPSPGEQDSQDRQSTGEPPQTASSPRGGPSALLRLGQQPSSPRPVFRAGQASPATSPVPAQATGTPAPTGTWTAPSPTATPTPPPTSTDIQTPTMAPTATPSPTMVPTGTPTTPTPTVTAGPPGRAHEECFQVFFWCPK